MHWSSWSQFFSMGGYAPYVWGSYGVTFVLLAAEVLTLIKRKRALGQRTGPPSVKARTSSMETAASDL